MPSATAAPHVVAALFPLDQLLLNPAVAPLCRGLHPGQSAQASPAFQYTLLPLLAALLTPKQLQWFFFAKERVDFRRNKLTASWNRLNPASGPHDPKPTFLPNWSHTVFVVQHKCPRISYYSQ